MKSPFKDKFLTLLAVELKRQGVAQSHIRELLPRIAQATSISTIAVPAARPSSDDDSSDSEPLPSQGQTQRALELSLDDMGIGDKAAMAISEVLLKYNNAAAMMAGDGAADGLHERDVDMWRVGLRHNDLTDRAVQHLALLITSCAKLSSLDVALNAFSEEGTARLLSAVAESPHQCSVTYDRRSGGSSSEGKDIRTVHTGGPGFARRRSQDRSSSRPSHSGDQHGIATANAGPVMPTATGLSNSPRGARADKVSSAAAAAAEKDTDTKRKRSVSPLPPPPSTSAAAAVAAAAGDRPAPASVATQRSSPSIEFATVPVSSRQLSTVSIDSRYLRQQLQQPTATTASRASLSLREEKEGTEAVDPAAPPPPPPRRDSRSPSTTTATSVTSRSNFASGSAEALWKRRQDLFSQQPDPSDDSHTGGSDRPSAAAARDGHRSAAPTTRLEYPASRAKHRTMGTGGEAEEEDATGSVMTPRHSPRPQSSPAEAAVVGRGGSPFRDSSNSPKQRPQREGAAVGSNDSNAAAAAVSHEPFEHNDQLDLTANLNPVLDSVLDLSSLMDQTGENLKQSAMFGGARSVWEVIEAYEEAADITARRNRNGGDRTDSSPISADLSAKLPPALIGGDAYNALTVLNISGNNLKAIVTLPGSLLRLDISNNELASLEGVGQCRMLTVLNARRNAITRISGLERNLCMAHLFLGRNRIAYVEGLAHLLLLETLDLTHNQLPTQSSLRALSLCSSLRHLLLKGNPFANTVKGHNYKPLVRNLCPTLLMLDDAKMSSSRYAEALQRGSNYLRQPAMIDVRQPRAPASSSSSVGAMLSPYHQPGDARGRRAGATGMNADRSAITTSTTALSSRRPADAQVDRGESEEQQQSMNLLYLLTRGVTAPMGYGDASNAAHTASKMAKRAEQKRDEEEKRRGREVTASGRPIREEVVKKLAAASKKYLEATIVDRMTTLQRQQQDDYELQHAAGDKGTGDTSPLPRPYGGGVDSRGDKPVANVAAVGYSSTPSLTHRTALAKDEEDLLRPYEPTRFRAPSAPSGKNKSKSRSRDPTATAGTASPSPIGRRSASTAAPGRGGGGSSSSPLHSPLKGDATVAEVYVVDRRDGSTDRLAPPPPSQRTQPSSYATIPLTDPRQGSRHRDAEKLDCSPIRCFDDSGLMRSFDASDRTTEPPRAGRNVVHKPMQPVSYHRPAAAAAYSVATSTLPHSKTVIPRDERWEPHPAGVPTGAPAARRRIPRQARDATGAAYSSPQPTEPIRTDDAQRRRVQSWEAQLREDTEAVQAALATVVDLLVAQRGKGPWAGAPPESSTELPPTYLQERRRCVEIIQDSGMLHDTQVPTDVVMYYGFGKAELESGESARTNTTATTQDAQAREEVLRHIRLLGDAKTCLRYMLLLIGDGRERLLQQYTDQVKESLAERHT